MLVERFPLSLCTERGRQLVGRNGLWHAGGKLAADLRSRVAQQLIELSVAAKPGDEFLGAERGRFLSGFRHDCSGCESFGTIQALLSLLLAGRELYQHRIRLHRSRIGTLTRVK